MRLGQEIQEVLRLDSATDAALITAKFCLAVVLTPTFTSGRTYLQTKDLFGSPQLRFPLLIEDCSAICGEVIPVRSRIIRREGGEKHGPADRVCGFLCCEAAGIRFGAAIRRSLACFPVIIVTGDQDRQIRMGIAQGTGDLFQIAGVQGDGGGEAC